RLATRPRDRPGSAEGWRRVGPAAPPRGADRAARRRAHPRAARVHDRDRARRHPRARRRRGHRRGRDQAARRHRRGRAVDALPRAHEPRPAARARLRGVRGAGDQAASAHARRRPRHPLRRARLRRDARAGDRPRPAVLTRLCQAGRVPERPYTAILFDLDGTITDSAPGITASLAHTFETLGLPVPTPAELLEWVGPPILESFRDLAGFDEAETARALAIYRER